MPVHADTPGQRPAVLTVSRPTPQRGETVNRSQGRGSEFEIQVEIAMPRGFWHPKLRKKPQPVEPRFWAAVDKTPAGCWVWTRSVVTGGYGSISVDGRGRTSHRVSWELHNGPIPEQMDVLHKCDNKRCVNPDHLYLGTDVENQRDINERGPKRTGGPPKGERHFASKLTNIQAGELASRYRSGEKQLALAREFGIAQSQVSRIVNARRRSSTAEGS